MATYGKRKCGLRQVETEKPRRTATVKVAGYLLTIHVQMPIFDFAWFWLLLLCHMCAE